MRWPPALLMTLRAIALFCGEAAFIAFLAGLLSNMVFVFWTMVESGHYFWAGAFLPFVLAFAGATIGAVRYLHPPYGP